MYRLGFDIGSTTIKAVLIDENDEIKYSCYRRHRSDIRGEMAALFDEIARKLPGVTAAVRLTGSAGLGAASALGLPFVQEVAAATDAVRRFRPDADVVIELGGEDAKITFLRPVVTQRMNGTCAGGTGAFIDQMAVLLQTDADGLDELASRHKALYTIASRCGVFAKSDMQPLLNEGASHEDLAASILQAVVNQTIAGLACGQPIEGVVVFLGGPLCFMPQLRAAFERTLKDSAAEFVTPKHADVFVALGAALGANTRESHAVEIGNLPRMLAQARPIDADITRLPRLFATQAEREAFTARHAREKVPRAPLESASGPCFLGIDAGSTTIKAALTDSQGRLLYSEYMANDGAPLPRAAAMLGRLYDKLPQGAYIGSAITTGYGEALLKTALRADGGEIETLCHTRAAQSFAPDVSFILDIGGQDMKSMTIRDGVLDNVLLNEACSSGCGSFIQTFAESLGMDAPEFGRRALEAESPVDLGTRCTVFMNSRVKQAQKEGADVGSISCGLSYSVVRNALFKVIKMKSPEALGNRVVVQGGTFLNDAILRAFEIISGREPIRPDIAGLMGAYGAALIAKERWQGGVSAILGRDALGEAAPESTKQAVCQACQNHCRLTVSLFSQNRRLVSGNRCERGEGRGKSEDSPVNLVYWKYDRLFDYKSLPAESAPRGAVGIPRALNMYENYPLWHTFFTALGFSVVLSRMSDHALFEQGMSSIPSESVCYPAKLAHGHVEDLIARGVKTVFYPCVTYEKLENTAARNHFNCPIVQSYPEVISANVDRLKQKDVKFIKPFISLHHRQKIAQTLHAELESFGVTLPEVRRALAAGFAELERFRADVRRKGDETVAELEKSGKTGVVLAGRPYHADPEIHHGLPGVLTALGFAVLTEDSVSHMARAERPLRVVDQWMYHTRLYDAAAAVSARPFLELVQLNSFGCGLDAITSDQVAEIINSAGKIYTLLKIDEVNSLGAARIRLRSLAVALESRRSAVTPAKTPKSYNFFPQLFTQGMRKAHTILAPQMSPVHFTLIQSVFRSSGYDMVILEKATPEDVETGLRFVNNDACYPCVVVVGQLVNAVMSGKYDLDNTSIFITQTGGGCRATNYVSMLRRALREAGYGTVPVVGLSFGGIERHPGFKITVAMLAGAVKAILIGDLLQAVLLRTRPYEAVPGSADELYRDWLSRCGASIDGTGTHLSYQRMIDGIVTAFEALPLKKIPRKPRVGLVGEILVKFHPDANNNAVSVIENEGCEAVVPGLMGFLQYCFHNSVVKQEVYGGFRVQALALGQLERIVETFENSVRRRLRDSKRFRMETPIHRLAEKAGRVLSVANQCGEGWLLTAEMIDLIENGAPNIICAQPFACLPNHVTGKGMIRRLRELYPQSNIVPIDYDPGASEVNQLNRIKLMLSGAFEKTL
ncbi:MAG: 2-hydroxyacyl-CoA dehydratase [Oscillospiraceae bacterium]|jgi:activator of 2-hydroxyglutaryl-CoA dehydratase/predicted nucleotide-binding protein (sugar kinase/HSP70/actin superfamily)|nr:2-hydroxyacyl-CoA dehydratase [Oscillospiraceae bacterium]